MSQITEKKSLYDGRNLLPQPPALTPDWNRINQKNMYMYVFSVLTVPQFLSYWKFASYFVSFINFYQYSSFVDDIGSREE